MIAGKPPWSEAAIAVERLADGEGAVVAEGTLREVVTATTLLPRPLQQRVRVSLPDRGSAPFSYAGDALAALIALLPTDDDDGRGAPRRIRQAG